MKYLCKLSAFLLKKCGRRRMIQRNGVDYLERFYIFSNKLFGIYLHRFWADDEKIFHDHPFDSVSILLSGGYFEYMPKIQPLLESGTYCEIRLPFRPLFYFRRAIDYHYILLGPKETWTLFVRFKRKRIWGFNRNGRWRPAERQSRRD